MPRGNSLEQGVLDTKRSVMHPRVFLKMRDAGGVDVLPKNVGLCWATDPMAGKIKQT